MAMTQAGEIKLTVKFEDGEKRQLTAKQIFELKDKRKYDVINSKGEIVLRKTFRG